jgi:hypothetical protein
LWLLASEYPGGEITASEEEICFRVHRTKSELRNALKPLIDAGFFVASGALAECYRDASAVLLREEKEIEKRKTTAEFFSTGNFANFFDEFWKVFPKREGANPKHPARKAFLTAVKAGTDPQAIIAGARAYAVNPETKPGTPYVPQAVTWLHQRRWEDQSRPQGRSAQAIAEDEERKVYWLNQDKQNGEVG